MSGLCGLPLPLSLQSPDETNLRTRWNPEGAQLQCVGEKRERGWACVCVVKLSLFSLLPAPSFIWRVFYPDINNHSRTSRLRSRSHCSIVVLFCSVLFCSVLSCPACFALLCFRPPLSQTPPYIRILYTLYISCLHLHPHHYYGCSLLPSHTYYSAPDLHANGSERNTKSDSLSRERFSPISRSP